MNQVIHKLAVYLHIRLGICSHNSSEHVNEMWTACKKSIGSQNKFLFILCKPKTSLLLSYLNQLPYILINILADFKDYPIVFPIVEKFWKYFFQMLWVMGYRTGFLFTTIKVYVNMSSKMWHNVLTSSASELLCTELVYNM